MFETWGEKVNILARASDIIACHLKCVQPGPKCLTRVTSHVEMKEMLTAAEH